MFAVEERDAVRDRFLEMAEADERVVGAAIVGSLSVGSGDRWSDLDLTFAVSDDAEVGEVLTDRTRQLVTDLDAVVLSTACSSCRDASRSTCRSRPRRGSAHAVPGSAWSSAMPERSRRLTPPIRVICSGGRWSTRVRRAYIARGRWWQATHCIDGVRDRTLALACIRRDLESAHGRGYDDLPPAVLDPLRRSLVSSLAQEALLETLKAAVEGLLRESVDLGEPATKAVKPAGVADVMGSRRPFL